MKEEGRIERTKILFTNSVDKEFLFSERFKRCGLSFFLFIFRRTMCFLFCEDKKSVKIRNVKITFGEYHFCYAQISFLGYIFLNIKLIKFKQICEY